MDPSLQGLFEVAVHHSRSRSGFAQLKQPSRGLRKVVIVDAQRPEEKWSEEAEAERQ